VRELAVPDVRIYQPAKTAMQSGRRKTGYWLLEFERTAPRRPDPLMGWNGSADMRAQVMLKFNTRAEAVAYAERQGLNYQVIEPQQPVVRPRSYAENFRA
jgi:hypothetical protein